MKKKLRKKILKSYIKGLDKEMGHQEELSKSSDIDIKLGANYTIGYISLLLIIIVIYFSI